tara:strand:- start:531 stop:713 length:183 start_codon:yes stop_codon:yes gene_type:complete
MSCVPVAHFLQCFKLILVEPDALATAADVELHLWFRDAGEVHLAGAVGARNVVFAGFRLA